MKRFSAIGIAYRSIILAAALYANSALAVAWGGDCPGTLYHNWGGSVYACDLTSSTFFNCTYSCTMIAA